MTDTSIVVSRTVDAPPERVFALLADPDRHPDLDGAGMVQHSETHLAITELGDVFTMRMHNDRMGHYDVDNVVTVYEPDRAIGWAPGPAGGEPLGHTYTWQLTPADAGDDTVVTLTYDWSGLTREDVLAVMPFVSREQLARSLEHLAAMLA